jgi:hypothetical protein
MHIQICSMRIQILREQHQHESYAQCGTFFCCSSNIMEALSIALCAFKMCRVFLNAHSNYGRGAALFYHVDA